MTREEQMKILIKEHERNREEESKIMEKMLELYRFDEVYNILLSNARNKKGARK